LSLTGTDRFTLSLGLIGAEDAPEHRGFVRVAGKKLVEEGPALEGEFALIAGSLPMTHVSGRTNILHVRRLGT
jgi:hypothetical protein